MYNSFLTSPVSLFSELERLQRELQQNISPIGRPVNIRAVASGTFPQINVGNTTDTIEIQVFAPGVDASSLDVRVHRGILTISGERLAEQLKTEEKQSVYATERFSGRFKRSVTLPDDADANEVQARYCDGVLLISIKRQQTAAPRKINIQ